MEEGGYTEYQYDYNGKSLAQLIDECVRYVVSKRLFLHAPNTNALIIYSMFTTKLYTFRRCPTYINKI